MKGKQGPSWEREEDRKTKEVEQQTLTNSYLMIDSQKINGVLSRLYNFADYNNFSKPTDDIDISTGMVVSTTNALLPDPIVAKRIQLPDGDTTITALGWAATGEQNSGFIRHAADDYRYLVNGSSVTEWLAGAFRVNYLTQGSVVFAGANGLLTQNNAAFFWDNANEILEIGGSGEGTIRFYNDSGSDVPFVIQADSKTFGSTRDDTLFWGYNILDGWADTRIDNSKHKLMIDIEADFESGGTHFIEYNMNFMAADGVTLKRPFIWRLDLSTNLGIWDFSGSQIRFTANDATPSSTGTVRWEIDTSGNWLPGSTSSYDIGSASVLVEDFWMDGTCNIGSNIKMLTHARIETVDVTPSATDARWMFRNGTDTYAALRLYALSTTLFGIDAVQANSTSTPKTLALNAGGGNIEMGASGSILSCAGAMRIGSATDTGGNGQVAFGVSGAGRFYYSPGVAAFMYDSSGNLSTQIAQLATAETIFNESQLDIDHRFEGDTLSHFLFLDATATTENIAVFAAAAPNWQAMDRGFFIGDTSSAPTGNPANGGFLYVEAGALKYRGSGGTVTTVANA